MLLRILSKLFRRPQAPDLVTIHSERLRRLHIDLQDVLEGFKRGDVSLEDLGEEDPGEP